MAYKMPLVVKDVYLPIDYTFISRRSGISFNSFSEDYKKEYGIDLKEIFELRKENDYIFVCLKEPCKLYAVSLSNGPYINLKNIVQLGIEAQDYAVNSSLENVVLLRISVSTLNNDGDYYFSYGFMLKSRNKIPESIGDLDVYIWEV